MESVEKERAYLLVKQLQAVTWGSIVLASSTDDKQHKTVCQGTKVSATQLGKLVYYSWTLGNGKPGSPFSSSPLQLHFTFAVAQFKKNSHGLFLVPLT